MREVGGDEGYAGKANREYCRERRIGISFARRGRLALEKKEKDITRRELAGG